jgi:hypothetical protein
MMRFVAAIFFLALTLQFAGCGSSEETPQTVVQPVKPQPPAQPQKPVEEKRSMTNSEKSFYPAQYDETAMDFEKSMPPAPAPAPTIPEPIAQPPSRTITQTPAPDTVSVQRVDTAAAPAEYVQGFRIQVYASSNYQIANSTKAQMIPVFPRDSIYVIYDPPVYKVRLGDFLTKMESTLKLEDAVKNGYKGAWVVPDRVVKHLAERKK